MADLAARLRTLPPGVLPAGRLVTAHGGSEPLYWLSDGPAPAGAWPWFRDQAPTTGLWPLLLAGLGGPDDERPWAVGEVFPDGTTDPASHDVDALLSRWWSTEDDDEAVDGAAPFGRTWPGLAPAGEPGHDVRGPADALAARLQAQGYRLGLVAAPHGAAAVATVGWAGPTNHTGDAGEIAAVLASWQGRFGLQVVALSFDVLEASVAAPPTTHEQALRVGAEQMAFCPDIVWQGVGSLEALAAGLVGRHEWWFWWD